MAGNDIDTRVHEVEKKQVSIKTRDSERRLDERINRIEAKIDSFNSNVKWMVRVFIFGEAFLILTLIILQIKMSL
ncbi:MAG: hypothetical protein IJU71_12615 [Selenomonadaceae bacterium]|nr:hypothetical protein [Selenomonadaceae bacterium]